MVRVNPRCFASCARSVFAASTHVDKERRKRVWGIRVSVDPTARLRVHPMVRVNPRCCASFVCSVFATSTSG